MSNVSAGIDNISNHIRVGVGVIDIISICSLQVCCWYDSLIFVRIKDLITVSYISSWNYCSLGADYVLTQWSVDIPCLLDICHNFICSIVDSCRDCINIILYIMNIVNIVNIVKITDIRCIIFIFIHIDILSIWYLIVIRISTCA